MNKKIASSIYKNYKRIMSSRDVDNIIKILEENVAPIIKRDHWCNFVGRASEKTDDINGFKKFLTESMVESYGLKLVNNDQNFIASCLSESIKFDISDDQFVLQNLVGKFGYCAIVNEDTEDEIDNILYGKGEVPGDFEIESKPSVGFESERFSEKDYKLPSTGQPIHMLWVSFGYEHGNPPDIFDIKPFIVSSRELETGEIGDLWPDNAEEAYKVFNSKNNMWNKISDEDRRILQSQIETDLTIDLAGVEKYTDPSQDPNVVDVDDRY